MSVNSAQEGYSTTSIHSVDHIPFTGMDAGLLMIIAVALCAMGAALRKVVSEA